MAEQIAMAKLIIAAIYILVAVVFGIISKKINESKGYYGGFWWGFFLGWVGLIVVALKDDNRRSYRYESESERSSYDSALSSYASEKSAHVQLNMNNGSWRCRACGRVNASYVTSCLCGLNQKENEKPREENWKCLVCGRENSKLHKTCVCGATKAGKLPKEAERAAAPVQISAADEIAKFKQLLDSGAITEEEYEAKKKQLLKL